MSSRATSLICCVLLVGGLMVSGASPAAASWYCGRSDDRVTARIERGHTARLLVTPTGEIHYDDASNFSVRSRCGGATVTNTNRIDVRSSGRSRLDLQAFHRPFAPGASGERGTAEIEVVLHGVTGLWVKVGDGADVVRVGRSGVNVNGDGDADIRGLSDVRQVGVWAGGGADSVSARGGRGTGEPWPRGRGLFLSGDDDPDVLVGRLGSDILDGGAGPDVLWGLGGADSLYGGQGAVDPQPAGDQLHGGAGDDVVEGSTMPDSMYGEAGDDVLRAADAYTDIVVDGGPGTDGAVLDEADPRTSIERLLAY